jgi:hypothetical protein
MVIWDDNVSDEDVRRSGSGIRELEHCLWHFRCSNTAQKTSEVHYLARPTLPDCKICEAAPPIRNM